MKISRKEEDFRIYVESEYGHYISSSDVLQSEKSIDKRIHFKIKVDNHICLDIGLTREEIKSLAELTTEVCKYL
jgi:hypothetical protein